MREIKFRGLDKNGIWRYGYYHAVHEAIQTYHYIREGSSDKRIDPLSLGQWTGFADNHGRSIYEGDLIAEIHQLKELEKWGDPLTVTFGEYSDGPDSWGLKYCTTGFYCKYNDGSMNGFHDRLEGVYGFRAKDIMVVGNIYQNSDLLATKPETKD